MKVNRVWVAMAVIFLAAALYEIGLKPQSRPLYERARSLYGQQNYGASLQELKRAYEIEPNSTDILVLMGWNLLKLRQLDAAREYFSRASRLDPKLVEAKLGLAYLAVETGQGGTQLAEISALLEQDPGNSDFRLAGATALRQAGRNLEAAAIFRRLLGRDRYGLAARKNLEEMYGIENLTEEIPPGFLPRNRPGELRMNFRAGSQYFQRRNGNAWENFYIRGVNIGPATPGHFASEPPVLVEEYLQWLQQIASLGANTVRVYTLLPPAFYRALQRHNETPHLPRLYLLQEVWLGNAEESNLFLPAVEAASRQEIARAMDVIHGQGDLPMRQGYANGLYSVDVSDYVLGYLIGRELPPHLVLANNEMNSRQKSYSGKYISLPEGNATEAWLASMMDYAVSYEVEKYHQQFPVGIANWPTLDPLTHPTESTLMEEISIRKNQGERMTAPPPPDVPIDDNDAVSVDELRLQAHSEFPAGLFAAYSVFPYYPDFLYQDPSYLSVQDQQGPNPFFGYLKALKGYHAKMPLLIVEYGLSTSLGVSRLHPLGWNHGGMTEREQGELLARMSRNIAEAGCAGGIVFGWQDEWYKANWLTGPLALPAERRPLWNNQLDPDQGFGLWTYDPSSDSRLFSGFAGWSSVLPLYQKDAAGVTSLNDGWDAERTLRSLAVSSDAAFVYLRLQVGAVRKDRNNVPDLKGANYYIGISTAPGRFGGQTLPGLAPQVRNENGANFLLHIGDGARARLLIASNYNPREARPIPTPSPGVQIAYRIPFNPKMENWSGFEEIVVETNRRRFSRNGRMFPAQQNSLSLLRYRPAGQSEDTQATWTCDFANKAFIFRLPWALLMVMDPSTHLILAATEGGPKFVPAETPGLQFSVVSFRPADSIPFQQFPSSGVPAVDSLPGIDRGSFAGLQTYTWPLWNAITVPRRPKAGFATVQKVFRELGTP